MGSEGILKVDWSLPSDECHEYITGSWLKVTDTQGDALITNNQFIPDDCQTRNESSLSIIVHTNSSTQHKDQQSCQIIIPEVLEECKVYSVQIIRNTTHFVAICYRMRSSFIQRYFFIIPFR